MTATIEKYRTNINKTITGLIMLVMGYALIHTAWVSEDAFITFRTVDNFVHGLGLVWNIGEKVQTYTNPLWMLIMSFFYFFTHEAYYTSIILSLGLSLFTIYTLLFKLQKNILVSLIVASILLSSHAFVDFTTSGLENPLTFTFIIVWVWIYTQNQSSALIKSFLLSLVGSLAMTNRLDTGLLFLPAMLFFVYQNFHWKNIGIMLLGTFPILSWLLFAWSYYGFIFPNTYYAKLYTGIPLTDYIHQGLVYCIESIQHDPITLLTISAALLICIILKPKSSLWLSLGSLLYVTYTIKNGGDFMAGRFFAAPFLLAIASVQPAITTIELKLIKTVPNVCNVVIITIMFAVVTVIAFNKNEAPETTVPTNGIANERLFFIATNSLINQTRTAIHPPHSWALYGTNEKAIADQEPDKPHVVNFPNVGMLGYFAGPKVYIVDILGLTDPFLSHLPIDLSQPWRIGHFIRPLPEGYMESKISHTNMIKDPILHEKYSQIQDIIQQQ